MLDSIKKHTGFLFSDRVFYSKLIMLGIPVTIQNLISSSLGIVDTVMVGALGNEPMAAVGAANQFVLIVLLLYTAVHSGASIYIAQFWGKKDYANIGKVVNIAMALGISATLLFTIAGFFFPEWIIGIFTANKEVIVQGASFLKIISISFTFGSVSIGMSIALRSVGKSFTPMVISGAALAMNTLLNYLLIFGNLGFPALGVKGSAIATLISRIAEMLAFLYVINRSHDILRIRISTLMQVTPDLFKKVVGTMIPVILNELFWSVGYSAYGVVYGRISTEAFDAIQITNSIGNLFFVAAIAIASASAVMIGHEVGAGNEDKAKEYTKRFIFLAILGGVIMGGLMYLASPLVSLYKVTPDVIRTAVLILTLNAVIFPIRLVDAISIMGILRGGGDATFAFIAESITMWLIGVPIACIGAFVLKLDVQWVYVMVMSEDIVKAIISLTRIKSGRWIKNVVREV